MLWFVKNVSLRGYTFTPKQLFDNRKELIESKKVSEYDQEIPKSQTAGNPMAPRVRVTQQSRDTRKTN